MTRAKLDNPLRALPATLAVIVVALAGSASAAVAATPIWTLDSISNTNVKPAGEVVVSTIAQGSASPARDEVQRVSVDAGLGQFKLSFGAQTTADLSVGVPASAVQSALEGLASIGAGNVEVSGGPEFATKPYSVAFKGALAAQDVAQIGAGPGTAPLISQITFHVQVANVGSEFAEATGTFTATLPEGLTLISTGSAFGAAFDCSSASPGDTTFTCRTPFLTGGEAATVNISAAVGPGASTVRTAHFTVEGAGAPEPASTVDSVRVSAAVTPFGIDAFDFNASADRAGATYTQAAGHPFANFTGIALNVSGGPPPVYDREPVEPPRDIEVSLPPGFVGYPPAAETCTVADLANTVPLSVEPRSLCSPESQVGTTVVGFNAGFAGATFARIPVFNLVSPPGVAARFGFSAAGVVVLLDARVRNGTDYGIDVVSRRISEGLPLTGSDLTFWGFPASPEHDSDRSCPDSVTVKEGGPSCVSLAGEEAFLRMPTSCTGPGAGLPVSMRTDSWLNPDVYASRSIFTHDTPGLPYPESEWGPQRGTEGCDQVPFEPSLSVQTTTEAADSPTGLNLDISLPQSSAPGVIDQADLKDATVTLPEGLVINPAAANGQSGCTTAQIGLLGTHFAAPAPMHFTPTAPSCPDSSKIGTLSIESPALDHPLPGAVYLAAQGDNPFGSPFGLYLVADDPQTGIVIKLPGKIETDPQTGQLTTRFVDNPQQPFDALHLRLFGGPRAALRNPPTCGTYAVKGSFAPWSGSAPASVGATFKVSQGPGGQPCPNGGFDPKLSVGSANPLAGQTSPLVLRVSRADATQQLGSLKVTLPPGLSGYLKGIPYCPDSALASVSGAEGTGRAQEALPSCPAASQVGTVTAGAGAGPNPFYATSGRAYLAGPYKGAPLSLAVVTPAVAGPFDLGSVVVRNALRIDPETAQITADSDPLPTVLHGIPLDLRDVRVDISRDHFTLNPTSCEEMKISSLITSTQGAVATPGDRFQLAGCDKLGFKPKLSLRLSGPTNRGSHPQLRATLSMPAGGANIGKVSVALPGTELLENAHIQTICTRVQFAAGAGGGTQCPSGSVYGHVRAISPLVDYPLTGPVILRSSNHKLPDLVAVVRGPASQPIVVAAAGRIDSPKGRIRTTFESFPDAPISKAVLTMQGQKKGLLVNGTNICRAKPHASVFFEGQNGSVEAQSPLVKADCGAARGKHKHSQGH